MVTNKERDEIAKIIQNNLEIIGIKVSIRIINYNNTLKNLDYDILLTGDTISIKPNVQKFLDFNIEYQPTVKDTYERIYEHFKEKPNFMGLYFNSITLLYSKSLRGNLNGNWFNIFYNIDTWYKVR